MSIEKWLFGDMVAAVYQRVKTVYRRGKRAYRVRKYVSSGRIPWTEGYSEYKSDFISGVLNDNALLDLFRQNQQLPPGYGFRLDGRVVEYPWVLSRISSTATFLLDAGSALNHPYILTLPMFENKSIVVYTLAPEGVIERANVSYIYGDLRAVILRDRLFEEIVCISTLEHVGMDNTLIYSRDSRYNEARPHDYRLVLKEFRRLLVPNGRLFITVPYGRYQNCGWLQQFDHSMINDVIHVFGGNMRSLAFYRYSSDGWNLADVDACADCEYFDIHNKREYDPDYAAAGRAVACIELAK